MTRTNAREIAAHLLYAMEYTGQPADRTLEARLEPDYYRGLAQESEAYAERPGKKQLAYIRAIVCGVTDTSRGLSKRGQDTESDVKRSVEEIQGFCSKE